MIHSNDVNAPSAAAAAAEVVLAAAVVEGRHVGQVNATSLFVVTNP
jgi:hypothetical protein